MHRLLLLLAALVAVCPPYAGATDVAVDRDLERYLILGLRATKLKNLVVDAPGCSVGVNCASARVPGGCGSLTATRSSIAEPGQVVADKVCLTNGSYFAVFRNQPGSCGLACSQITHRGSASDCSDPFTT